MTGLNKKIGCLFALLLFAMYSATAPQNHAEAEDVYDFALKVEQGTFADQAGVNRVLALPAFGVAYQTARALGYSGRAFELMILINRLLAVACVFLFYKILCATATPSAQARKPTTGSQQLSAALLLAFSYGFWRYANEAETYMLASVLLLGAWRLALLQPPTAGSRLSAVLCPLISAFGVLVHLLNAVPLLLIIPLYYLLSKDWKKALWHGGLTGLLVLAGYAICSPRLDFSGLGAQNHALEGGLSAANLLRGGIAFGQCLVSGNFLFGFESFREMLVHLFPSRMLAEEFFMAAHMPGWIKWAGGATLSLFAVCGLGVGVLIFKGVRGGGKRKTEDGRLKGAILSRQSSVFGNLSAVRCPLFVASLVWFLLYAAAVIRTEAGSPELWIMALVPFWLLAASLLRGASPFAEASEDAWGREQGESTDRGNATADVGCRVGSQSRKSAMWPWFLVIVLFTHNLIAGLLPVLPKQTDYHTAKAAWILEHAGPDDLVLTDYEPVMIFYLRYHLQAAVLNSGQLSPDQLHARLGAAGGHVYALASFFEPMASMRLRSPHLYAQMKEMGGQLRPRFKQVHDDAFGGVFRLKTAD